MKGVYTTVSNFYTANTFIDETPMNVSWNTKKVLSNTSDPEIWGPSFWFTVHNGASKYPIKASPLTKERTKNFLLGLPVWIPCESCKEHCTAYIENNYSNMDYICDGRENLFNFLVDFHNIVNKRYKKPIMSHEDARKLYIGNVRVLSYS